MLGFRKFLIFKLMREAGQHGKRFSDVVEVAWRHLQTAHAPIAYLRKLLTVPVDFAFERQAQRRATQQALDAARDAEHMREVIARCANRTFFDTSAQRRLDVAQDAATLTVLDAREARPRVTVTGWQADFVAALEAGKLQAATPELAERFEAQRAQAVQGRANARAQVQPRAEGRGVAERVRHAGPRQMTETASENLARMMLAVGTFSGRRLSGLGQ